jgi:hypothetical protein
MAPRPDVRVPVHPPPGTQAVVEVEAADPPTAKALDRPVHHRLRSGLAGQVVARGEEVAGVQADADPLGRIDLREDPPRALPVAKTVS